MIPCLQPKGQAMVGLKQWFQIDLLKFTEVYLLFHFDFIRQMRLFFTSQYH